MKYFFIVGCIICYFQFISQDLDTSRQLQTFEKTISKFIINDDFLKSPNCPPTTLRVVDPPASIVMSPLSPCIVKVFTKLLLDTLELM